MTIDWQDFALVVAVSIGAAALVVTLFATGIRLWSTPAPGAPALGRARDDETDEPAAARPLPATVGGVVLFALAGAVVLTGVVLLVT